MITNRLMQHLHVAARSIIGVIFKCTQVRLYAHKGHANVNPLINSSTTRSKPKEVILRNTAVRITRGCHHAVIEAKEIIVS